MHRIVTMHRIVPQEVAEGEKYLNLLLGMQEDYVLATVLDRTQRGRHAVPRQDHVLLEMDMDRMRPLSAFVPYSPDLGGPLHRVRVDAIGVEDLPVDDPGA